MEDVFHTLFREPRMAAVIFGRSTDQRLFTLWDARLEWRHLNLEMPDDIELNISASQALAGAHISEQDHGFDTLRITADGLSEFFGLQPITTRDDVASDGSRVVSHEWRGKSAITADLPGATLAIGANLRESGDRFSKRQLHQWAEVVARLAQPKSLRAIHDDYITPFRNLMTFVTGVAAALDNVVVGSSAEPGIEVEVIWRRPRPRERGDAPLHSRDLLLTSDQTPTDANSIFPRWLEMSRTFHDILNLFLGTRYAPFMFEQNRFLNLAQATEAFHRERIGDKRTLTEAESDRNRELLNVAPDPYRAWLNTLLEERSRFTFAQRLRALLARDPTICSELLSSPAKFVRRVTEGRNLHTHWDRSTSRGSPEGFDLWALGQVLVVLMEAGLLEELGFDQHERRDLIADGSRAFRAVMLNPIALNKSLGVKEPKANESQVSRG